MAYRRELDDSEWDEVAFINSYAMFIGYISMGVMGLGYLILTWSTVVLLGGFVSMLPKKDFWCLTFITLVQTARVFDEKLSYIVKSAQSLMRGVFYGLMDQNISDDGESTLRFSFFSARMFLSVVSMGLQLVVFSILLCPLSAIYIFGQTISTGISIWRLIQHDYGGNSDAEANLKPAMDTLYYLVLLQGALFWYRFFFGLRRGGLATQVLAGYHDDEEREVVWTYMRETRIRCEENPSFAKGRNLITHAVDLIGSKSHDDSFSGVKMLYTAICMGENRLNRACVKVNSKDCRELWDEIIGQHMLMKILITSVSSSPVLQKLLQTLDPRGAFDKETRNQGATIVAHLALDIHLEQFPEAIEYICTLIGSFEEYRLIEPYHRDLLLSKYDQNRDRPASRLSSPGNEARSLLDSYEKLVLTGLCILRKLATRENNRRIMGHTQGLLSKIMAPLTSDMIHEFDSGAWSTRVVEESLKIMSQLVAASGETGAMLRRDISSNNEAISIMEKIVSCANCNINLQKRAMGILTQLYMDTKSCETFIRMLVDTFADNTKDRSIRKLAGKELAKLPIQAGGSTSIILQVKGNVVGSLTKILLDDAEDSTCRTRAAEILEQMCIHHNQDEDDERLSKLKKDMTDTMPKVFAQIPRCGLTKDEVHGRTEADQDEFPEKEIDIENPSDSPQDNARHMTSSSIHPQNNEEEGEVWAEVEVEMDTEVDELDNDEEFHAAFLSLVVTVCDIFVSADEDLACQFGTADAITLPRKLKDMVTKNNIPTVPCLRLMKLTCKMVISMMEHKGSYQNQDLESLLNALSSASKSMYFLDRSMVFAREDQEVGRTMKPVKSLHSLVKEAKKKVATYFKPQEPENIEPFTSTDG